jgi:hypothetical protein
MTKMFPEGVHWGLERIAAIGLAIGALVIGANLIRSKSEKSETKKNG